MNKLVLINLFLLITIIEVGAHKTYSDEPSVHSPLFNGCTVITISKGDSVFFGGNDDYRSGLRCKRTAKI